VGDAVRRPRRQGPADPADEGSAGLRVGAVSGRERVRSPRACGWSLARAHARSGDRLAIAAYLGAGTGFDRALATFSSRYADQNELDYTRLAEAVAAGEVQAQTGV